MESGSYSVIRRSDRQDVIEYDLGGSVPRDPAGIRCLCPLSLAGLPAVSVPVGFARVPPVGLQLVGRPFDDGTVLEAAKTIQDVLAIESPHPSLPAVNAI